jgi:tetratricopeptide (TPR) repeat protein
MIALVTILAAVIAWRSALAGTFAGNAEDEGLLASLTRQETVTITTLRANQHKNAYLQYKRYDLLAKVAALDGRLDRGTDEEILARLRPIQEQFDLATTNKGFFPVKYITKLDAPEAAGGETDPAAVIALADAEFYDVEREIAEEVADVARNKDLVPEPKFSEADALRDKSVALIATLILLAISLWLFAAAETVSHWIKWVWAVGGGIFLVIGSAAAWAIEAGAPLAEIYRAAELASIISGVALGIAALVATIFFFVGRGHQSSDAADDEDSPAERRFKESITIMIASVALFAALVGWLQADSGAKGDLGIRNAQRFATEALGVQATGEAKVNFDYSGAALAWQELDVLLTTARKEEDEPNAAMYEAVRDHIFRQSELLSNPKYFDPASGLLPYAQESFQSDTYLVKNTQLAEQSRLEGELNNAWEDKANSYITHLTLLAAALALFGLSMTFSGLARPVFVLVGTALTAATAWSVIATFSTPVRYTPNEAVAAYARGVGAQNYFDQDSALAAFDEAVKLAPGYANALYERGNVHYFQGNYDKAASDFEAARGAGRDDSSLAWNLGWTYYLLGKYDEAITESRKAYELDKRSFGARLNLALSLLAKGRFDEARSEYDKALGDLTREVEDAKAAGQQVAPSVWFFIEAGANDLESLNDRLLGQEKSWTEAPPKEKVAEPDKVREVAEDIFISIKSLLMALETTGKRPGAVPDTEIGDLRFGVPSEEDPNTYEESLAFSPDAGEIHVIFTHDGLRSGQAVNLKVYVSGIERPGYRKETVWASDEPGETAVSFTSDYVVSNAYVYESGEYVVELYLDHHLWKRSGFTIEWPVVDGE